MQSHYDSIGLERRRLPFTLIENIVLEDQALGPVDLLVYLGLAKHADTDGVCWPSQATIAKTARVHRSSVAEAIKHLEAAGYLKRTARFRPDGGVTSNVYRLMPLEAKKYSPISQNHTPPCRPGRQGPVVLDDTNYTHLKLDPKKESPHAPEPIAPLPTLPSDQLAPVSLASLIDRIRQEAQVRNSPPCFIAGNWPSEVLALLNGGASAQEIVKAFTVCLETAPERVTFFPRDFLKWRKVSHERSSQEHLEHQRIEERQARQRDRDREREQILRERESPDSQAQIQEAMAHLPWRRERS